MRHGGNLASYSRTQGQKTGRGRCCAMKQTSAKQEAAQQELPAWAVVLAYLHSKGPRSEEVLYADLRRIVAALEDRNVFVDLDFKTVAQDVIYSEKLEDALQTCESAGLVREREGSIIYELTAFGIADMGNHKSPLNELISMDVLAKLEKAVRAA